MLAFWGERRTLADTRRGADDSMVKNSMKPDPADCSILHSPCRPALSACPSEKGQHGARRGKAIVIYKDFHKETAILDLHYPGSVGAIAFRDPNQRIYSVGVHFLVLKQQPSGPATLPRFSYLWRRTEYPKLLQNGGYARAFP